MAEAGGGSGGGAFIVHVDDETNTLDKTWAEVNTAIATQPVIILRSHSIGTAIYNDAYYVVRTFIDTDRYITCKVQAIEYVFSGGNVSISMQYYHTNDENGYPIKN